MKSCLLSLVMYALILGMISSAQAQQKVPKPYFSSDGEMIFGFNQLSVPNQFFDRKMRFSFFPHVEMTVHKDFSKHVGIYTGLSHTNIGLRLEDSVKKTYRSLVVSAPVGIKVGNFEKGIFLFGGMDFGYFYHYKERYKFDDNKYVFKEFNSDRINTFNYSWFVGLELPGGVNVRVKYYLQDFFNNAYVAPDGAMPYAGSRSGIWYISIGSRNVLGGNRWQKKPPAEEESGEDEG